MGKWVRTYLPLMYRDFACIVSYPAEVAMFEACSDTVPLVHCLVSTMIRMSKRMGANGEDPNAQQGMPTEQDMMAMGNRYAACHTEIQRSIRRVSA